MSEAYVSEIRMFAGNFAPMGWALCDGRLLDIGGNELLFSLIGTTYGGNGQTNFALPDLRGRAPIHTGNGYNLGQLGGTESVTLTVKHLPAHAHTAVASMADATVSDPTGVLWGAVGATPFVANPSSGTVQMNAGAIAPSGGNTPHDNMMPYLTISYIIALDGLYPSRP